MVKWQDLVKYGGSGLIGIFFVLGGLLNLAGVDYFDDGNKHCYDCYSEIKVKSTYWEIKVEHAGDKDIVFKKRTRSRTLWVNLDKITELVTTNPQVKVDILVPTIKKYAIMKHEDYGYLRHLKEDDILIKRNTKSKPSPSRIILHGINITTKVKWSFELDHWLMEDINIDPIWFGEDESYINHENTTNSSIESSKTQECRIKTTQKKVYKYKDCTEIYETIEINNETGINVTHKRYINYTDCPNGDYIKLINTTIC